MLNPVFFLICCEIFLLISMASCGFLGFDYCIVFHYTISHPLFVSLGTLVYCDHVWNQQHAQISFRCLEEYPASSLYKKKHKKACALWLIY